MKRIRTTTTAGITSIGMVAAGAMMLGADDNHRGASKHVDRPSLPAELFAAINDAPGTIAPMGHEESPLFDPGFPTNGPVALSGNNIGLIAAANNIVSLQCPNGGFDWPYGGCADTHFNITAPITMGLLRAYEATGNPAYLNATIDGANHDLNDTWSYGGLAFASFDPMWLWMLSETTGDPSWANIAQDDFFERLSLGTYGDAPGSCGGTDYFPGDTGDYIERHKCLRSGSLINLRPWDMQYMPYVAGQIGFAGQQDAFINDSILDGLNNLDENETSVEIGLAGGVHALALVSHSSFAPINSPNYSLINGIDNLCDLADALAGEQMGDGSWVGSTQFTAFAVLALEAAQNAGCGPYDQEIEDGRALLWSLQDKNDGAFWSSVAMSSKNIQVQGDVLMATASASDVTLNSDPCVTGGTLTVDIDKNETPGIEVFGGQFFLEYDTSVLSNPVVTGGDAPFDGAPFFIDIDTTAGTIDIGTGGGDPFDPEGTEDAITMATITFDAAEVCTESDLVTFRPNTPPTRLTDGFGNEVLPDLNNLDDVTIDGTAPTVVYDQETLDSTSGLDSTGVLWRYADPGTCEAAVNWDQPVAGTDYSDNCTADGDITVDIISAFQPGDTLAAGQTDTVTYRFTDACGNFTDFSFTVEVVPFSVAHLDFEIPALSGQASVERCIEAVINSTQFGVVTEEATAEFANGVYTDWTTIPCDSTCAVVRDPLHTLWAETSLTVGSTGHPRANAAWHADANLTSGDLNGDNLIDILDFGVLVWQFGEDYGTGDTDCNTPFPHADMTGDGLVGTPEFTVISNQFLFTGDSCPLMMLAGHRGQNVLAASEIVQQPRTSVTVEELERMGLGHLRVADLNNDGVINEQDIAIFISQELQ